jgi:hypothetical protein
VVEAEEGERTHARLSVPVVDIPLSSSSHVDSLCVNIVHYRAVGFHWKLLLLLFNRKRKEDECFQVNAKKTDRHCPFALFFFTGDETENHSGDGYVVDVAFVRRG